MGDARRLKHEGCLRRCHAGITPHSAPRAWRLARRGEAFGMCPLLQSTGSPLLHSTPVRRWCVSVLQSTGSPLLQSTASHQIQSSAAQYLVAQALLQSMPLFSRHLRRKHAQGHPHTSSSTELGASSCCRARRADATEHCLELARRCYRAPRRHGIAEDSTD